MKKKIFIHTEELDIGGYPDGCPFNSRRAGMVRNLLGSMNLLQGEGISEAAPARLTRAELETFHASAYLDAIQRAEKGEFDIGTLGMGLGSPDCPVFKDMFDYLTLAVGGTVKGARMLRSGEADVAFNPSGGFHHAGPDYAAGFCYLNDIVLAAKELSSDGMKVLFLDVDVHHCDGVQDAFYSDDKVMTISMHEDGRTLFPGTGAVDEIGDGPGKGYTVNIPLPVGTYDDAYRRAYRRIVSPLIKAFDPDFIILELGMDALAGDPMAHLHLTNNVYVDVIKDILALDKPLLATGGGGYNVENTVRGWALCWQTLCGEEDYSEVMGMGGVMMESTEWSGGFRDRMLISNAGARDAVDKAIDAAIAELQRNVFPIHGL